jgi:hypothetical protein
MGFNYRQRQNIFLHSVQTGSGTYPASYTMDNRGSFPDGKAIYGVKPNHLI